MTQDYVPPEFREEAFHCPHCGTFAHQIWLQAKLEGYASYMGSDGATFALCSRCSDFTIWWAKRMIHPVGGTAPLPHPQIPDGIKADYEEAREIANISPRGAAALLRLAIQKLSVHLGQPGKNLNDDIGALVRGGLPAGVQKALDVVRVIGGYAVHPGTIDVRDDPAIVASLFKLVNIIVEKMIAEPVEIDELFAGLPDGKKAQIAKRDAKPGGET